MSSTMDRISAALGRSIIAGLVGTAAMTVSSTLEAKFSGRGASTTPADAVGVVAGIEPKDDTGQARLNNLAHWGYGISWGVARGGIDLLGLRGPPASLAHFAAVFGAEQALLPALGVARPTPAYGAAATATDVVHHGVYAGATGLAYDWLARH